MNKKDEALSSKWNRFIEEVEPHRLALFRYCLGLTSNPFDAEDLVSEAIMKTFASRSFTDDTIESILAFMIRVASRLWIEEQRRVSLHQPADGFEEFAAEDLGPEIAEAADTLYEQLAPEQRAVLVLKEVFDMSHKEISTALSISEEKSRVTLHRSKSILSPSKRRAPRATRGLVEQFISAFLAHDAEQVKSLLLDEIETVVFPAGREIAPKDEAQWLSVSFEHQPSHLQIADVLGDLAILVFRKDEKGDEALEEVWLLEESAGRVSRIIDYGFSPVLVGWIADFCGHQPRNPSFRFDFGS
ncbi:MAG: RNA polymerase sigma factor [Pseudomonadota bacterium]